MNPEVTVFMALYNGEKYIRQAINSVLQQTFKDIELLIIDDGSIDNSVAIVQEYSDSRIRLLQNGQNLGLFRTRNKGVEESRGKFFATLDCDDIAAANRLELQLKYLYENKTTAVCGGRVNYINSQSEKIGHRLPLQGGQDYLKSLLLFTNIFINSATIIESSVLKRLMYRKGYEPAEDYDLFERIAAEHNIGMINDVVCSYRVHSQNISGIKSNDRKAAERLIITRQLERYGFKYSNDEMNIHLKFTTGEFGDADLSEYKHWFKSLLLQNAEKKVFHNKSFQMALAKQWLRICIYWLKSKYNIKPFLSTGVVKKNHLFTTLKNSI